MGTAQPGIPASLGFAPVRRGALNSYEICFADQKRMQGVSWQNIAHMLGRHVEDVRGGCDPKQIDRDCSVTPPVPTVVAPPVPVIEKRSIRVPLYRCWTPEQDAAAKTMWQGGTVAQTIGKAIGKDKNSVIGRARRMGWGPHPRGRGGRYAT